MHYYKLIDNGTIVGAINSNNFIYYSPVAQCYLRCDESKGEYISYEGKLYRTTWMWPIVKQENYIEVEVIEITQAEYEIFKHALDINEVINEEQEEEVEPITPIDINPADEISLDFVRSSKIQELSHTCRQIIENGFDLELRGEVHHFSLDTQDQLNLISLSTMAQTQSLIPYHADGEMCIFYTSEEMNEIVETATAFKVYHTTYYNALKGYVNALDRIDDIAAIQYGDAIPEEYQSDVLKALTT